MIIAYLLGGLVDIIIMWYTVYFLIKVRFYHCIQTRMGRYIKEWSWLVALCGIVCGFMPYYSIRALIFGFDNVTIIATAFQLLVWTYALSLYIFHIKTTRK